MSFLWPLRVAVHCPWVVHVGKITQGVVRAAKVVFWTRCTLAGRRRSRVGGRELFVFNIRPYLGLTTAVTAVTV